MEEVKTQKILFYNGTYVKDRKYGLVNDYLTYEENPKRDYNVYLDLDSDNIYHVDVSDEEQFEQENIVIKIKLKYLAINPKIKHLILLFIYNNFESK